MVCKVYIGNLGNNGTKHEIERAFSKFGPLVNVWVARNPPGFAFVEFEDSRDAEDSVRSMDGAKVCGMRVRVQLSHNDRGRRDRRPSPRRRYRSRSPAHGRGRSYSPRRSRSRSYSRSPRHVSRGSPRYDDYRKRSESPEYSRSRSRY